jgi:Sulfotransferase family
MVDHSHTDIPSAPETDTPTVVYVMGAGRSGSTILGVALGNCAGTFFAGELNRWLPRSGIPRREEPARRRFWEQVQGDVDGAAALFDANTDCLERSSALLDVRSWRTRRRLRQPYRSVSENLYRAIARASGAAHIVDSSHYPLRARELQSLTGIDLYILYLVRDPRDIVASMAREDVPERRFDTPTANAYLWWTNLLSVLVFLRHPRDRRVFVRHEDLLADPHGVLAEILRHVGSSAQPPALTSLRTGVPFHGNRLIGSETVDLERRGHRRAGGSRTTYLLQRPWAAVFRLLRPMARRSPTGTVDTPR